MKKAPGFWPGASAKFLLKRPYFFFLAVFFFAVFFFAAFFLAMFVSFESVF
jgi:hypothetical protein